MPLRFDAFTWPSEPPRDCPIPQSDTLGGIRFDGTCALYSGCDTWYPSWASDDCLYSPWADGVLDGHLNFCSGGADNRTAHAVIRGDDPRNLEIRHLGFVPESAAPYLGRYPSATLVHEGIWYYGTYCIGPDFRQLHEGQVYNWPIMGPMPGFRVSRDFGATWTPSPHSGERPLFAEPGEYLGPVKIGAPHFVDFGRNMRHSPDGKAYLVAHGSDCKFHPARYANNSWITGDQVYLLRVTPSPGTINERSAYEFFGGYDGGGEPTWTSRWDEIVPLLEWQNNMGCVNASYNPALGKFLMCVTEGWPTCATMNSYILEADRVSGPWRMVTYMRNFGEQAYFLNFPTKFMGAGGMTMWLCYSGLFADNWNGNRIRERPPGSRYGMVLQQVTLLKRS